jgi:hypothetical protein
VRGTGRTKILGGSRKMVWIYVDTNHYVGHPDHLKVFVKVFAGPELADEWFKANDPEGVVFGYEVIE